MSALSEGFGASLRGYRLSAGLTQEELAERAGLSARGIQDLERGVRRAPHADTARRLASALELTDAQTDDLLSTRSAQPITTQVPDEARPQPELILPLSFIGRDHEVMEISSLLSKSRLVTLAGPGGIGKTRLALEIAARLADQYSGGIGLAELGALTSESLVLPCVATALGIREQSFRPLVETVLDALRDREVLLVLDNCEHLIQACASVLEMLLQRCARFTVLATSRERLRASGEVLWRVPPLDLPRISSHETTHLETLRAHAGTRLFLDRAEAVMPNTTFSAAELEAIASICRQLDGVPLAIELAAARTTMLSVEDINTHLDNAFRVLGAGRRTAPARQRTLSTTFDWSYNLLSENERVLLERLSILAGSWTLNAAESIAAIDPIEGDHVLELLGQLVDKSLVMVERTQNGSVRYRLHEMVRQLARVRLTLRNEVAVANRHAVYYLKLAEEIHPRAYTADRAVILDQVELDLDNFRAAQRWFIECADVESALRLPAITYRLLLHRGYRSEGRATISAVLARAGGSSAARAQAYNCLSMIEGFQADYNLAAEHALASYALQQRAANKSGVNVNPDTALMGLGQIATMQGDFDTAAHLLGQAIASSRSRKDMFTLTWSLAFAADLAYLQGDFQGGRQLAQEAVDIARAENGNTTIVSAALATLGDLWERDGNRNAAVIAYQKALACAEALAEEYWMIRPLLGLAKVAFLGEDASAARKVLGDALRLARQMGDIRQLAQIIEAVAHLATKEGHDTLAMSLAGAADAMRETIGAPLSPIERLEVDAWLNRERARTNTESLSIAFEEGREWSVESAVKVALQVSAGERGFGQEAPFP